MELLIVVAFIVGTMVGMFLGTLVVSLCAIAGREDNSLDTILVSTK